MTSEDKAPAERPASKLSSKKSRSPDAVQRTEPEDAADEGFPSENTETKDPEENGKR